VLVGVSDRRETIREETEKGSACSESGHLSRIGLSLSSGMALGLCTLRCIALHFCFSIACCFVRVGFPFNPCAINIVTHVVGGIFFWAVCSRMV